VHVEPAAQTVPPVQPLPPHCPYLGTVPPELEDEDEAGAEELVEGLELVEVEEVAVDAGAVVVVVVPLKLGGRLGSMASIQSGASLPSVFGVNDRV